jgi:hypothetical protein
MLMQAEPILETRADHGDDAPCVRPPGTGAIALAMMHCFLVLATVAPAFAFVDREFCVVAQQFAIAAEKDIGVWIDRVTRNAGMAVSCDKKTVEFTRFTYAPSASMDQAWKERKAADWNAIHCGSAVWNEAIRNGWKIVQSVNAADGGRILIAAQCAK